MRGYGYILFVLLNLVLPAGSMAQSFHYQLETFGTRNGLRSTKIYALSQTSDRMLWIGTELGVSIYNGYEFNNYQYTDKHESIGRVLCITQDSLKNTWIGGDKGLFYFSKGAVRKITLQNKTLLAVEALLTDAGGNVWAGDMNGLYQITAEQLRQVHEKQPAEINLAPYAGFNKRVFCLSADHQQNIYAGSFDGIFKIPAGAKYYETKWTNPNPYHAVFSITATSPDSIFWNILQDGPMQMIGEKASQIVSTGLTIRNVFKNRGKIYFLHTEGIGRLKNGVIQPVVSFNGKTNNAIIALTDAEENIWTGSWEGLLKFRKTPFTQYQLPQTGHKEVFSFLERKNGELLFGGNRGTLFTKKNNEIIQYPNVPALFPLSEVMCMYEDDAGGLWAGSGYQGISRYKNNRVTNWKDTGFVPDNNCEEFYPSGNSRLLASTENGVTVIQPSDPNALIAHYSFKNKYTRKPELYGCFQTGNSVYWFYGSQGLFTLVNDVLAEDSIHQMPVKGLYINKIIADKKGNIWVATLGKGLLQCRYQNGVLVMQKQFDSRTGLPSDNVLSVIADKNDDIWCGDYMSFSVLKNNPDGTQIISFNEQDGLLSTYYQTLKFAQQQNGTIWGLTTMGMVSFHPDSINRNNLPPTLFIHHVSAGDSGSDVSGATSPSFTYNENSVHFGFTGICLTDPTKIRYAYRLRELDSNWTYTTNRTVDFIFLRPGRYTFELKACNNNNVWTSEPLPFTFTVRPPFWQTWWFRALMVLVIAAFIFLIFRIRFRTLKTKSAIKQQITELEAKALRAQMNPHFIFNSLNAIQELVLTGNTDDGYRYLSDFSKLLRMVLNHSEKNFIPLSNELEMVQLYLSLESLRFKQSFSYHITISPEVEPDITQVPPLLLQPFAENAIWHGLRNKAEDKQLTLQVYETANRLVIEIEDNGIGREKALAIKQQKIGAGEFDSKGSSLSQQRINIINQQYPHTAQIEITDLVNEAGEARGTKVTITLPLNANNT